MRIPNLGETELLVPLHSGVFEQPMWQTFLRQLRRVCDAAGAGINLSGSGDGDVLLADGVVPAISADMREARVYSGAELDHDTDGLRAVRVTGERLSLTLAVLAPDALGAEIASLLSALVPHLRVAL